MPKERRTSIIGRTYTFDAKKSAFHGNVIRASADREKDKNIFPVTGIGCKSVACLMRTFAPRPRPGRRRPENIYRPLALHPGTFPLPVLTRPATMEAVEIEMSVMREWGLQEQSTTNLPVVPEPMERKP